MIARTWRGTALAANANDYYRHFTTAVAPRLKTIPGHRGSVLLRREVEGHVEFMAVTLWDSMDTIKQFAGPAPDVAKVEPEAQAALVSFDDFATHYDVTHVGGVLDAG